MWILIVIALNSVYSSPGSSSYKYDSPSVTMQEFGGEKQCMFAATAILKHAGDMAGSLKTVCVAKDAK